MRIIREALEMSKANLCWHDFDRLEFAVVDSFLGTHARSSACEALNFGDRDLGPKPARDGVSHVTGCECIWSCLLPAPRFGR